jgi:glycosyltransferase involved in cell wall biosynthesis
MRIGLSTSVIQRGQTGIAAYVFALTRAFLRGFEQHHFVLFVLEADLPLFNFTNGAMDIVPISERHRPPGQDILWHQRELPRLARQHQLDVLHIPSYRRLLWPRPCALVATVHDLAAFHVSRKYDWKRMFFGRVVARVLARRQDEIIAISQNTARDMAAFWKVPKQNVTVIHHGIDQERFSPAPPALASTALRQRFGLSQPFFLYVARLEHPAKNHVRLIESFERFKAETRSPWQLVLAGSDWHGAEAIHAAIQRSPVHNDIRCLGFVPDHDLPGLYRTAHVFVYPSLYEGFGFPPLEAMACGCPVLSSTRGALGEVVGDAALTVDPEDATALQSQLTRLARDAKLREQLRTAGLERASHFEWQRAAARTLEVYSRAATKRRRQGEHLRVARNRALVEQDESTPNQGRHGRAESLEAPFPTRLGH